ncbi:hypothetical protein [Oceanobacillus rekensis]|uniref:hypothetical protein n=1 Tax=Oceanobacillus rekensis TaxID=937927 RepID=UPI000B42D1DC|nr:hypothetical protein [Oceanobacillus rekensis]
MNDKLRESISDLLKDKNSDKVILSALKVMLPTRRRWEFLLFVFVFLFFSFNTILKIKEPVNSVLESINTINIVLIPILTIAITGYAIFQALVSGKTLITLMEVSGGEYSKFKEYNFFFLSFSVVYLFSIILNFFLGIFFFNIESDWSIPIFNNELNYLLFTLAYSLYLTFIINLLVEVKCFLINLYQIFVTNAIANGIEYINKDSNNKDE